MKIKEIMTPGVEVISIDSTARTAAEALGSADTAGVLPVHDEGVLEGIVTDKDIARLAAGASRDPGSVAVSEIMSREFMTLFEDEDVEDAVREMRSRAACRAVVLNRDERPVGIVTLSYIALHSDIFLWAAV